MSNKKHITFENEGLMKIVEGVKVLARTVGSTLGPGGRNVIYDNYGFPLATKDGVTVARQVALEDKLMNIGIQMVKQVANKTCNDAGDGTTTATVLAAAILEEGCKYLASGMNRIDLVRAINKATETIVDYINKNVRYDAVTDKIIHEIATVSANWDDEIGGVIGDAISRIGVDGTINIEDSTNTETSVDFIDGVRFNRGYINPYLINNQARQIVEMDYPYVLLYNGEIHSWDVVRRLCEEAAEKRANLFIVADEFEARVLTTFITNVRQGRLSVAAIKAPWYRDMRLNTMDDLAVYLGTKYFDDSFGSGNLGFSRGIEDITLDDLGRCKKVIVTGYTTTFIEGLGKQEDVKERIAHLKEQMEDKELSHDEVGNLEIRVNQLCGSVATVKVGASSEVESQEKKDRIDDAVRATRAAISEGIVPGGSYAYLTALKSPEFKKLLRGTGVEAAGAKIIEVALKAPFLRLMENAGLQEKAHGYIDQILVSKKKDWGFNIKTKKFENLIESGVIDPYMVTRSALQNATSVAGVILTSEAVIVDEGGKDLS